MSVSTAQPSSTGKYDSYVTELSEILDDPVSAALRAFMDNVIVSHDNRGISDEQFYLLKFSVDHVKGKIDVGDNKVITQLGQG